MIITLCYLGCRNRTRFSNVLQANTKVLQNDSLRFYKLKNYTSVFSQYLQIVVSGLIPSDTLNTKPRQKLLEVNQLLQDKCTNYTSVYFLKPDTDWTTLDGRLNKTIYYKDNIHLLENWNKKLVLSIKTKLVNFKVNCHEIAINKKVVPTMKAVDYQRASNNFVKKWTTKLYLQNKYQTAVTEMPT